MEESEDRFRGRPVHAGNSQHIFDGSVLDRGHGFKILKQGPSPGFPDARDVLQRAVDGRFPAQMTVKRDREAVGFVPDLLDQVKGRALPVQNDGFLFTGQKDFLQPFRQAEHGNVRPGGQHGVAGKQQLLRTAVDQDQVWHRPFDLRIVADRPAKTPAQHLVHGSEVVGPFHGLDPVMAVFLLGRLPVDKHHHRSHGPDALGVGNIIAFDAARSFPHADDPAQFLACADGALPPDRLLLVALKEGVVRVFLREQDQRFLFSALGDAERHRSPALFL